MELAEPLSLALLPGSVPYYMHSAKVWRQLIVEGAVPASDLFRQWAEISGQGGYGEAAAVRDQRSPNLHPSFAETENLEKSPCLELS